MKCKIHHLELICPKCRLANGGKKTAKKHDRKLREWGKLGGRPRNPEIARIMEERGVSRHGVPDFGRRQERVVS